jgi:hypothetical protein
MDPRYFERHRFPKWNVQPSPLMEPRLLRGVFPELSKDAHVKKAREFVEKAERAKATYHAAVDAAEKKYGSHGPLISGIVRGHFPEDVKEHLRDLAGHHVYHDAALAHWKAAGKRGPLK